MFFSIHFKYLKIFISYNTGIAGTGQCRFYSGTINPYPVTFFSLRGLKLKLAVRELFEFVTKFHISQLQLRAELKISSLERVT